MKDNYFFYKIQRSLPRVFFPIMITIGFSIGFLLIIETIITFKLSIVSWIGLLIIVFELIITRIYLEISWVSQALMDPEYLCRIKTESNLYKYISHHVMNRLQYGMTFNDILRLAEKDNQEIWKSPDMFLEGLKVIDLCYFQESEKFVKIIIRGFGDGIPTPKLVLKFRNNKLIYWNDTASYIFRWSFDDFGLPDLTEEEARKIIESRKLKAT